MVFPHKDIDFRRLRDAGIRPMDCMPARENDEGGEGGPRKFSIGGVDVFVL